MKVDKYNLTTEMERTFNASKDDMYEAHTSADKISQWWGPKRYQVIVEKFEPKEGGEWRITHKGKKESGEEEEYSFYGKFLKLDKPNSIKWTFNYEPIGPGHTITETLNFEDAGEGKTSLRTDSHYSKIEDLEGMVNSGMEAGANEAWDRLAELVKISD